MDVSDPLRIPTSTCCPFRRRTELASRDTTPVSTLLGAGSGVESAYILVYTFIFLHIFANTNCESVSEVDVRGNLLD